MKTTLNFLCAGLLALFTSSCLEHSATIRLNKDGSGTITEETVFSAEASAMMAQMPAGGDSPAGKFADAKKAAAAATKMGEGVTVEKVEKIDKDGRTGGRVVYNFKDINKVKFTFGEAMSDAGMEGPPGAPGDAPDAPGDKPANKPITFKHEGGVLTLVNPEPEAAAKKPAEGGDAPDAAEEIDPQSMAMMQGLFKDMKMSLKVEIVDGIAETNATHVEGNTITLMDMAFGKLLANPEHMKKLSAMQMQESSPAEAAAAFKGVEGFKIETKDTVTVKMK
jgi:hypothetical protein